jgi:hypothetical protein
MTDKPITRLKQLLGFSSAKEVATFFNLTQDTANNINSGRGSANLRNAYINLCSALEYVPAAQRRPIFSPPALPEKLSLSQYYHKKEELGKKLLKLLNKAAQNTEDADMNLQEYIKTKEEYTKLKETKPL